MSRRQTALLALVIAALLAAAWVAIARFATARRATERAAGEERGSAVLAFVPARAASIRIAGREGEVQLSRGPGGWEFTAPVPRPADRRDVDALLDALASLRRRATSAPAGLPAELLQPYGLDAPRWRVEVRLDDGRRESLAIGGTTGPEGIAFVMPTKGDVAMISTTQRQALEAAAEALGARVRPPSTSAGEQPGPPSRAGTTPARGR
jgi:hypothetical protein